MPKSYVSLNTKYLKVLKASHGSQGHILEVVPTIKDSCSYCQYERITSNYCYQTVTQLPDAPVYEKEPKEPSQTKKLAEREGFEPSIGF
jgi:hypothetical protein